MDASITPVYSTITPQQRMLMLNQNPLVIWFTGLSGSGKSTLAIGLEQKLFKLGFKTYLLDGDNLRSGLNRDLSFSNADRSENIRRVGEVSKLFCDSGLIVLSAFISPFQNDRNMVKKIIGPGKYLEVFVDAPLKICQERDVKGLYKKVNEGALKNFTGIHSLYELPQNPNIKIKTDQMSVEDSLCILLDAVKEKIYI